MNLRRGPMAGLIALVLTAACIPLLAGSATAAADDGPWTSIDGTPPAVSTNGNPAEVSAARLAAFTLDPAELRGDLPAKPVGFARQAQAPRVVSLPAPDGSFQRFELSDASVMEAGLAAEHPEIATYAGRGLDDPTATIRADLTPLGFHASVRSAHGNWYIDPYYHGETTTYASYYGLDLAAPASGLQEPEEMAAELQDEVSTADVPVGPDVNLRTYRLALVTDPSYAAFFGADNVTAAKVTLINRVTQIYEDETAIRLVLVNDTEKTNLNTVALAAQPNGPCGAAACFTPAQLSTCGGGTLSRNRIVLGQLVGASNYDVGHIGLGVNGGGVASLGVVGGNSKAQGCTGLPTPVGDFYAVDYVSHEMGHQFAGNHTFNGTQLNCSGGNRSAANSVEPGSGSSIMAYAGICRQDDLQPHSDPYWSQRSYTEITTYVSSTRPAINEVQTASLYGFDTDGDSFTISYDGAESAPIVRGVNYTTAGIKAAIEAISTWPAGGVATVAAFGGTGALNDTGFQVTFTGTLAATNVTALSLTSVSGTEGFVGETAKGGAIDNGGFTVTPTGNHAPVVTVASSYTIPVRTPFALTGSATDSDGDTLTYLWEQNDRGAAQGTALVNNTKTNGPLFRQFSTAAIVSSTDTLQYYSPGENVVSTDPTRVFPDLAQIVAGNTNAATGACPPAPPPPSSGGTNVPRDVIDCYSEFLPTADWIGQAGDRTLHMRLTARDGHPGGGGVGSADVALVLAPGAGPFLVTSHSAAPTVEGGSSQSVTWDVAGTDAAPVSTSAVKITYSIDGGQTFPYVLAESTANDGEASVTIPNYATSTGRIKIEAVGNVFFDLNDADIVVTPTAEVTYTGDTALFAVGASATAQLRATLQDRSLAPGDIRSATVTFREGSTVLCTATVALLGAETTDGSAGCTATLPIGGHSVDVEVGGGYAGGATATVTVTAYSGNYLTGNGTLTPSDAFGPYTPTGTVTWATDAKINGANRLTGSATVSFQSGGRSYQIRGSSLIGLGANGGASQTRFAATLVDVTAGSATVASGLTLALTATDSGSPGRNDTLGLTLWNGDTLLFSTSWTGVTTAEVPIASGNLTVH